MGWILAVVLVVLVAAAAVTTAVRHRLESGPPRPPAARRAPPRGDSDPVSSVAGQSTATGYVPPTRESTLVLLYALVHQLEAAANASGVERTRRLQLVDQHLRTLQLAATKTSPDLVAFTTGPLPDYATALASQFEDYQQEAHDAFALDWRRLHLKPTEATPDEEARALGFTDAVRLEENVSRN